MTKKKNSKLSNIDLEQIKLPGLDMNGINLTNFKKRIC